MKRLIGFILGATVGVLVARFNLLDGGEIQATRYCLDALGQGLWSEATKLFAHSAALKLAAGLVVGGVLGTLIQYMVERQVHVGRR
jgi:hypothetical protein